jgi:hypothetical protein
VHPPSRAPVRLAIALATLLAAAPAAAQWRVIPGVVREGKVVTKIHVTLSDSEDRYEPVAFHRLRLVRQGGDTLVVTATEAGALTLPLDSGRYALQSVEAVWWKGQPWHWDLDILVEPGMELVDLTSVNATSGPVRGFPVATATRAAPPPRPAQRFAFGGVPWGVPADSVRHLLAGYGYPYLGLTDDGGLRFRALVEGYATIISARLLRGGVERIELTLLAADSSSSRAFDQVRAQIVGRYGEPVSEVRAGESTPRTARWRNGSDAAAETLTLTAPDDRTVRVIYESPAWRREAPGTVP